MRRYGFLKSFILRYGWIFVFPPALLSVILLKVVHRKWGTSEKYRKHQEIFFAIPFLRDASDKFHGVRRKIAEYAFDEGLNKSVLEIGTGHGFQSGVFDDIGFSKIVAVDLVPERIRYSEKLFGDTNIDFRVMDAEKLDFPNKHFDVSSVSAVLHDMPTGVKKNVIAEMVRVTKRRIILFEPRTFKNPLMAFVYGKIGSLVDESLNFVDYVKDDLDSLLKAHKLMIVKDEIVWGGVMNIKVLNVRK